MPAYTLNLSELYGEQYGAGFKPNTRNIRTGALASNNHHCPECSNTTKRSCYENFHWSYCIVPLTDPKGKVLLDASGKPQICGERLTTKSSGCCSHPYNLYSENLVFREALRGKPLSREAKTMHKVDADKRVEVAGPSKLTFAPEAKGHEWYQERERLAAYARTKPEKVQRKSRNGKLQPSRDFKAAMLEKAESRANCLQVPELGQPGETSKRGKSAKMLKSLFRSRR
jgi:hypothetical protein